MNPKILSDLSRYFHRVAPTPLVPVQRDPSLPVVWCKLEFMNPSGSTKDRIARFILEKAWRQGRLRPGDRVMEASSGSTSIALALSCAQLGLRFTAVMPESVSNERVLTIRGYGGDVCLTPREEGVRGSIAETERQAAQNGVFLPRQFSNPDNPEAHRVTTAREILDQIPGGFVDAVVSGVGTGGTLVGLHHGLSESGCGVVPVLARPVNIRGELEVECCSFSSRIPGVTESLSQIFASAELPGLVTMDVPDEDAICITRSLIRKGFPVGPSSGLNFAAAEEMCRRLGPDARVVTVFPDRMERYFTTELFGPMKECGPGA
ncbi:MAG: PLP-dependent cysteine synthase family protein [Gemmataceae bacterium]